MTVNRSSIYTFDDDDDDDDDDKHLAGGRTV
jgi:hypothetical protein